MTLKRAIIFTLLISSPLTWAADHTGTILETMDSGGYTYAKIKENQNEYWVAGSSASVKTGDVISFSEQMNMPNFTSKTLDRTFENLMFVGKITQGNQVVSVSASTVNALHGTNATSDVKVGKVSKAEDGYTVAELFRKTTELNGKKVKVRGTVVKVSNAIMKSNWIHIQDGTGSVGQDDIIFRAPSATANVGDVVLASGTLIKDKDFGSGYKYAVIVEDASFKVEK